MKGQLGFVSMSCHFHKVPAAPLWRRVLQRVLRWRELARQRRLLATMSDEALKDIGLSRADVQEESERPFWMDNMGR
ncbi:DUF1127 domain-containing protein [Pseudomonas sp. ZM23]|uniref:DUF1127 domain-containing protein n=1 Tax=Pseudomonas triclosanedens TaxID=2961893 RepID=A0ABY6ZV00_9PSED|nr:DUF1127 domain-containing protein [Pseudomonas triclosanedens]MCP8467297.1 DUF1127 domain-containing protein [Pseudomonas triclosanedens]MCP8472624.1 DUF1127 domain-containing protein [Pseudomonas triclosanedens]MCP8478685.1 DUF1127 domain-containing protein [Pseudomonas triclosanedens]WAI47860.1 DUF1127 domain-containing protein [Pseudomonas triclosanedens]